MKPRTPTLRDANENAQQQGYESYDHLRACEFLQMKSIQNRLRYAFFGAITLVGGTVAYMQEDINAPAMIGGGSAALSTAAIVGLVQKERDGERYLRELQKHHPLRFKNIIMELYEDQNYADIIDDIMIVPAKKQDRSA